MKDIVTCPIQFRCCSARGVQSFSLVTQQFLVADDPDRMSTTSGSLLPGMDSSRATPSPNHELGLVHFSGELFRRVPVSDLLSVHERRQLRFDLVEASVRLRLLWMR
jgi:hypothetical protein